jgi:IS30 family transposase
MSTKHLTHEERSTIASLTRKNRSVTEIANLIDRHRTTVWRELKRNSNSSGTYTAPSASKLSAQRSAQASCRASRIAPERWEYIEEKLCAGQWSPEEIRNRMVLEGIAPISHEAIYQRLWTDKKAGGTLHTHLRHKIRSYRKRGSPRERRGHIPGQRMIGERPPHIEHRARFGDYEMDTVIGKPSGEVLVTMVERRSRYLFVLKASNKSALAVSAAIISALHPHRESVHTLTYDNGKEFSQHALIDEILGSQGYFANPYHSWERGLNENTNGLLRQYFPKQTDFGEITDKQLQEAQDKLNNRPRKCLGWRTPNEVISNQAAIVALPS